MPKESRKNSSGMSVIASDSQGSTRQDQNVAIGFNGDPVPPFTGIGAALTRNIQRFRFAAASPSASRSQLSKIGVPIATRRS